MKYSIAVSYRGRNNKTFILLSDKNHLVFRKNAAAIHENGTGYISTQVFMVYIATEMKIHFMTVLIIRKIQDHFIPTDMTWESHAVSGQRETQTDRG